MKHIVAGFILSFLVLYSLFITNPTFAQTQKRYDIVKERIQKELNVDEPKADSAATILKRYFTRVRSIRENEGMNDQNKQLAIKNN